MSRTAGLLLFLLAAGAEAQVTLSTVQGGVATPVGQFYDFGSVAIGTVADTVFRLTNTGAQSVYLTQLALSGPLSSTPPYPPYFSVVCSQSPQLCGSATLQQLPALIDPGGTLDFTVQFEPFDPGSPSATMTIAAGNTISVILSGAGVEGLTLLWKSQTLAAGQTVDFGNVQVGTSQTIALYLANQTSTPLTVPAIRVLTGSQFHLGGSALSAPLLSPGSSAELDVAFQPASTGPQYDTLYVGLLNYPLAGSGTAPPPATFPAPSITVNLPIAASAQQGTLSITLASASSSAGTGTVTLAFQSAVSGVSDDPSITFADGTRSATFSVAQGATTGQFPGGPTVEFGTGTTAGTLIFSVTLGSQSAQTSVVIPAAMIGIDAAVAARDVACAPTYLYCTATNVELQINGWDNTRTASQVVFRFYDSGGNLIAPGAITADATSAFQQYFAGSDLGGVFGLHALFPVTGDSDQVTAAQVQIINSAGSAQTANITF